MLHARLRQTSCQVLVDPMLGCDEWRDAAAEGISHDFGQVRPEEWLRARDDEVLSAKTGGLLKDTCQFGALDHGIQRLAACKRLCIAINAFAGAIACYRPMKHTGSWKVAQAKRSTALVNLHQTIKRKGD